MDDVIELPTIRNFTMITQKLYDLFLHYIIDGRKRAPPERKLKDLIPTFQRGAKTDRRALQSKFKSWSKRMAVENGTLKLSSSNKEIVPLEKCSELVMRIHFDGHKNVDRVIFEIKQSYTWSKKNFGMDRFMVLNYIAMNCSSSGCRQNIEAEVLWGEQNLMKAMITSSECSLQTILNQNCGTNQSILLNPSSLYPCPVAIPMTNNGVAFTKQNVVCKTPDMIDTSDIISNKPLQTNNSTSNDISMRKTRFSQRKRMFGSSGAFRKPRYAYEFKALIEAANKLSSAYPSILTDTKTKFLGSFDLVPKKILSKKTLMKFLRERKKKRNSEKQHMLYHRNRKNLRDRNKLNKIKIKEKQEKPAYLDVSRIRRNCSSQSEVSFFEQLSSKSGEDSVVENSPKTVSNVGTSGIVLSTKSPVLPSKDVHARDILSLLKKSKLNDSRSQNDSMKGNNSESKINKNATMSISVQEQKASSSNLKTENQSFNSFSQYRNIFPIRTYSSIPPNIKSEIAILPSSTTSPKIFSQQTGNLTELQKSKNVMNKSVGQGKKLPSILQPIGNANVSSINHHKGTPLPTFAKILPKDTNIFLVEKTASGEFKMIPCKKSILTNVNCAQNSQQVQQNPSLLPKSISIKSSKSVRKNSQIPQDLDLKQKVIGEEMSKLLWWIKKMKISMMRSYFQPNVTRSTQRLKAQLSVGISIVRNVRRNLIEAGKLEDIKVLQKLSPRHF